MLAVQATALAKNYRRLFGPGKLALAGLTIEVEAGAFFGLIGPNGAGKTTMVKLLLGVVQPTAGAVRIFGRDPQDPVARRRIGYLPERLQLPGSWTPLRFLASVARFKGLTTRPAELAGTLERIGLGPDRTRRMHTFSKGMRQRVGLAAAFLGRPDLLVLDEPTDGLDPLHRAEVRRFLLEERNRGATLFLNSHLLTETERICDRVGIIAAGRLVRAGSLDQLCGASACWRLRFQGPLPHDALAAAGLMASGEPHTWQYPHDDPEGLNRAIAQAQAAGALLVQLERETRDLEAVLAEAVVHPP